LNDALIQEVKVNAEAKKIADSIKEHQKSIMKGGVKLKIYYKDKVKLAYGIGVLILFAIIMFFMSGMKSFGETILISEQGISDLMSFLTLLITGVAFLFVALIFFAQTLFQRLDKSPKLKFAYKINKSSSLDNLTQIINELIKICFIEHKIIIHDVQIINFGDPTVLLITFS